MKNKELKIEKEEINEELLIMVEKSVLYRRQKEILENILYTEKKLNEFKDIFCSDDMLEQFIKYTKLSELYCESMELYLLQKKAIQDLDKKLLELKNKKDIDNLPF